MPDTPPNFDLPAAHRYFAAQCFNRAWDLMEKTGRSPEENRLMVALNQASLYHWQQRADCDSRRLSVGFWQASRIQALLGNAAEARRHAEVCREYSQDLEPFYLGYAFEALARAALLAGDASSARDLAGRARGLAGRVESVDERGLLLKDLATLP